MDIKKYIFTSFYLPKDQTSFTSEEVYGFIDSLKAKIYAKVQPLLDTNDINLQNDFKSKEQTLAEKNQKLSEQVATITKEKVDLEAKLKLVNDQLLPLTAKQKQETAKTLLQGLVTSGAETDVYELLNEQLAKVEFKEGETLKDQQAKVKPLLDEIFKTKPYLKPSGLPPTTSNAQVINQTQYNTQPPAQQETSLEPDGDYKYVDGILVPNN